MWETFPCRAVPKKSAAFFLLPLTFFIFCRLIGQTQRNVCIFESENENEENRSRKNRRKGLHTYIDPFRILLYGDLLFCEKDRAGRML